MKALSLSKNSVRVCLWVRVCLCVKESVKEGVKLIFTVLSPLSVFRALCF